MTRTRRAPRLLVGLALLAALAAGDAPASPPAPRRICSVSLAGDELLALLVPADRVVCVSRYADDPDLAACAGHWPPAIPRLAASLEAVLARRPDLVVAAPWNRADFLRTLRHVAVPVLVLPDVRGFEDVRRAVLDLGRAVKETERARRIVRDMDARLAGLARRLAGVTRRPRVLFFSHLVVAGAETTIDEVIDRAGGRNAARELGITGHRRVSLEAILSLDPDVLLVGRGGGDSLAAALAAWPALRNLRAVREGRTCEVPARFLTTVGPALARGAEAVARCLHPGRFSADSRGKDGRAGELSPAVPGAGPGMAPGGARAP